MRKYAVAKSWHISNNVSRSKKTAIFRQECHIDRVRSSTELYINSRDLCLNEVSLLSQRLRWSRGSVLVFGTQIRGFKPGRSRRIFQGEKILSTPSFGREVKPFVPCRRFTECKRSLNVTWKSGIFRQNSSAISRPSSSSFHYYGLW